MIVLLNASEYRAFDHAQDFLMNQKTSPPWSQPKQEAGTYSDAEQKVFQAQFEKGYAAGKKALQAFQKVCI
jgi:hypothetical protein